MLTPEENEILTRVGPETPMGQLMRQHWTPVCLIEEVAERDGTPLLVEVLGERYVAFRDSDGRLGLLGRAVPAPAGLARARTQRGMAGCAAFITAGRWMWTATLSPCRRSRKAAR